MSQQLLENIYKSYYSARNNKRNTISQLKFELDFEHHLHDLYNDIINKKYELGRSITFVVTKPVHREIFAASFRDRVVHHLLHMYLNPIFEKQLINDTYSCRKGKGTLFGVRQVQKMMRSCTENYTQDAYVLKLDISGYFMSMNKSTLHKILLKMIANKLDAEPEKETILYVLEKVVFHNPVTNCFLKGTHSNWKNVPRNKSLFYASENCGLPIGNLTSQLFGNVYLNFFDHFIKKEMGLKYYGRYVDDMVFVHKDKQFLLALVSKIQEWLTKEVALQIHPKKIYLQHYTKGVLFLGHYIKPYRSYVGNRTKANFYDAIHKINKILLSKTKITYQFLMQIRATVNSYLGFCINTQSFNFRKKIIKELNPELFKYCYVVANYSKIGVYKWCKQLT